MAKGPAQPDAALSAKKLRVAVVVSRYNSFITDRLLQGATSEFAGLGGKPGALSVLHAPGSFELPQIASAAAHSGDFDAVVALGCLIKGETRHDEYIAQAVALGLTQASVSAGVAVGFGVLTVDTQAQAEDRAGGAHGNKGAEAMRAAVQTAHAIRSLA